MIGENILTIDVEDIYFLTGLSRRGDAVQLTGTWASDRTVEDMVAWYCIASSCPSRGKILIRYVVICPLRTILLTITRVVGSQAPHTATQTQMLYAEDCMSPMVFNWCEGLLANIRAQLTKCRCGELKQFGYGSIIVSFLLEQVPLLHL